MDRIEFIGAQGAGKSTVFRHLLRQRAPRDRWLTPGEARIRVAQRLRRRDLASPWRRGVCLALRWNLLPLKREAVAGWLLRSSAPAVFDALPASYYCPRDEEKVLDMLRALGRDELEEALAEQGGLAIHDDICQHEYRFGPEIIERLFSNAGRTLH